MAANTANIVLATLNVTFAKATSNGQLKLEIDDREDSLNNGKTYFEPGDDAYYLMFKDSDIDLVAHESTAGGISGSGSATKQINENITFSNSDTGSLGYPPSGSVSMQWLGRSIQIKTSTDPVSKKTIVTKLANPAIPEVDLSNLKMKDGKKVVGILNCTYSSDAVVYKLSGVPKDFKESMITAVGLVNTDTLE